MTSFEVLNMQWGGLSAPLYEGVMFSGSSGPPPTAIPVTPPASLFPATTGAIAANGPAAIGTATTAYTGAASGLDVGKMYQSVVDASKRGEAEGQAALMSSMGAGGMASSSDAMRSVGDFQLQYQANLLQQLQQMQFQNEAVKMGGAQGLMETYGNSGMAFAPTEEIMGSSAGPSAFSQFSSAASGAAMAAAMLMMACWVAMELYGGESSLEVLHLRSYLSTRTNRVGRAFWRFYIAYGKGIAKYIHTHAITRKLVKSLFDHLLSMAFAWRIKCPNQVY